MSQTHRTPKQDYTTKKLGGCYTTITMGILPLAIHFLQLFGKASIAATVVATLLVILKIAIEYHRHISSKPVAAPTLHIAPAPISTASVAPFTQVPYHAPIAGCYLCQHHRPLRPYQIDTTHRVGVCQDCYSSLEATHHRF